MPSPVLPPVVLSDEERSALRSWAHHGDAPRARRAQVVLRCADGGTIGEVAHDLGLSRHMVSKWRSRFLVDRLDGLADEPRSGRPRSVGADEVELVLTTTRTQHPPSGRRGWSTRLMAQQTGVPAAAVARIWREHRLRPADLAYWPPPSNCRLPLPAALRGLLLAPALGTVALLAPGAPGAPTGSGPRIRDAEPGAVRSRLPHLFRLLDLAGPPPPPASPAAGPTAGPTAGPADRIRDDEVARLVLNLLNDADAARPDDAPLHVVSDSTALFGDPRVSGWIVRRPRVQAHLLRYPVSWPMVLSSCLSGLLRTATEQHADRPAVLALEAAALEWSLPWGSGIGESANRRPFVWSAPARLHPN